MKYERIITWALAAIVFGSGAVFGQVSRWAMETASLLSAGSVPFSAGSGLFAGDPSNFSYSVGSHYFGLGTSSPASQLHIAGLSYPQVYVDGQDSNVWVRLQPGPTSTHADITSGTVDNEDSKILMLSGGGAALVSRGAVLELDGNEAGGGASLKSGNGGEILIDPGLGDIRWGKPLVSLGIGPTATLGGTGGDGPTISSQVGWIRGKDSNGEAIWIPAYK